MAVEILDAANLAAAIIAAFLAVRRGLFFLPGSEVAHDAEIMVGELQIIFGLNPVARKLRVAREVAIFFDHLGAVAARPAVDAVGLVDPAATARLRAVVIVAVVVAAATATALPVVHVQLRHPVE